MDKIEAQTVNLRNLPSQTDAAFWVIVIVVLGVAISASVGASPIYMLPITLSLIILPVRALLVAPARERRRYEDLEETAVLNTSGILSEIQNILDDLLEAVEYNAPVYVVISKKPDEARAFGTWRQHYIFLGSNIVQKLHADWNDPENQPKAHAFLLHEIGHIANKDVQRITYTRYLLYSCFLVMGWWALFLTGWMLLTWFASPVLVEIDLAQLPGIDPLLVPWLETFQASVLTPEMRAEITQTLQDFSIGLIINFIFQALFPLIGIGFVLWLFYWRRMVRIQEYYADHLAVTITKNKTALLRAFGRYPGWVKAANKNKTPLDLTSRIGFSAWLHDLLLRPTFRFQTKKKSKPRWYALHPTYKERFAHLHNPLLLNQKWRNTAVAIIVLVLAFEILIVSPVSSYYLSEIPIHFPTIAIFILITVWLLPLLIMHESVKRPLFKMLLLIFGIRFAWIFLMMALIVILGLLLPDVLLAILNLTVMAGGRYAGSSPSIPLTDPIEMISWIPAYLLLQTVPIIALVIGILLYKFTHQKMLVNTPEFPWQLRHWQSVVIIIIIIVTCILNPLTFVLNVTITWFGNGTILVANLTVGVIALLLLFRLRNSEKLFN